jgi:hypothetical protein
MQIPTILVNPITFNLWKYKMKNILILFLSTVLVACGGADAQTEYPPPIISPLSNQGLRIEKNAGPLDGYHGGLNLFRDAYNLSGGIHGHVNTGLIARTRTGQNQTTFEWTSLFLLDNYADAGENVAMYAQANAFGKGPSWAIVGECTNAFAPHATCVGAEINVSTTGPDTGNRIGIDIVLADGPLWRGLGASSIVEGTAGIRIGTSNPSTKYGRWTYGLKLDGNMGTGIDTTDAQTKTAIKLKAGQQIELGDGIRIDYKDGQIRFLNGTRVVHQFAMQ